MRFKRPGVRIFLALHTNFKEKVLVQTSIIYIYTVLISYGMYENIKNNEVILIILVNKVSESTWLLYIDGHKTLQIKKHYHIKWLNKQNKLMEANIWFCTGARTIFLNNIHWLFLFYWGQLPPFHSTYIRHWLEVGPGK